VETTGLRIEGIEAAQRTMRELDLKIRKKVVSASIRVGNKELVKAARARAPRGKTGNLARQIRGSVKTDRKTGTVIGTVRPRPTKKEREGGRDAWYGHIVIGGAKPHTITVRRRGGLTIGGGVVVEEVQHPGHRGNDFMKAAATSAGQQAVSAFSRDYGNRVEAAARAS
jgi:HK97 gp10 family phage protein